jgi:hypothetical protein
MFDYSSLKFVKFSWVEPEYPGEGSSEKDYEAYFKINRPEFQPGHVLHMKDDKYILIGDLNKNLGSCDDCCPYELEDIKEISILPGF